VAVVDFEEVHRVKRNR